MGTSRIRDKVVRGFMLLLSTVKGREGAIQEKQKECPKYEAKGIKRQAGGVNQTKNRCKVQH